MTDTSEALEGTDVHALGKQLLDVWDKAFSGTAGRTLDEQFNAMGLAACFGGAAYDANPSLDSAPTSMMEAFLVALADPTDKRLDYLRARNQPNTEGSAQ